jgi:hypothetical protein
VDLVIFIGVSILFSLPVWLNEPERLVYQFEFTKQQSVVSRRQSYQNPFRRPMPPVHSDQEQKDTAPDPKIDLWEITGCAQIQEI